MEIEENRKFYIVLFLITYKMEHKHIQQTKVINGSLYLLIPKFIADDLKIKDKDVIEMSIKKIKSDESE